MARRTHSRRTLVWTLVAPAVLVVLAAAAVLVPNLLVTRSARDHIVTSAEDAPTAQVAIVLGAKVSGGMLSPMLLDRVATGVALYQSGKVDKLLLSGDHGQTDYDEVNAMLAYALEQGVPEEDVFTDHAGFSTYETMYRARDVFKVSDALVVTQGFHLPRAVYTARSLGLQATGVEADLRPYFNEGRFALREWPARMKAFFQLHLTKPEPTYLGPEIPIDGDGRATRG